jgi:hypothetical protein
MLISPMRSDQEHFMYTGRNRTNGKARVHCINRTQKRFEEMKKNSDRGNYEYEILENPAPVIIEKGKTCPNCKKVIQSEITIKGRTGRPSKKEE